MTEVERIEDQLSRAFEGEAWHGDSLREILAGVTAEAAAARPLPRAHSIWELVLHLAFTQEVMRRRLEGERVAFSAGEDFPPVEETSEAAWEGALAALWDGHRKLLSAVSRLGEAELEEAVAGRDYSRYVLLHGLAQHAAYHGGQIALLKKTVIG